MSNRMNSWCPSGCGKSVCFGYKGRDRRYFCDRCKRTWKDKQTLLKSQHEVGLC